LSNYETYEEKLFTGPFPTFPETFMQIRSAVFAQSC